MEERFVTVPEIGTLSQHNPDDGKSIGVLRPSPRYRERHNLNPLPDASAYIHSHTPVDGNDAQRFEYPRIVLISSTHTNSTTARIHQAMAMLEHAGWEVCGFGIMTYAQACLVYSHLTDTLTKETTPAPMKRLLNDLWAQKINNADAVYVLNFQDRIGHSMAREIAYAKKIGKDVFYMYPHTEKANEEE